MEVNLICVVLLDFLPVIGVVGLRINTIETNTNFKAVERLHQISQWCQTPSHRYLGHELSRTTVTERLRKIGKMSENARDQIGQVG